MVDTEPFYITFRLAIITTLLLFLIGVPLAYALASTRFRLKVLLEAIVSLPIVLPPSVLGFYLLLAFSPANVFGKFLDEYFNLRLVFSFEGLVIASVLYSLPFMVQPVLSGFRSLPSSLKEASYTLGKDRWTTLIKVLLPNIRTSLITGCILSFAHTVGEFGVVLMVGGNIPGETRLAAIALYDEVEAMNYHNANVYAWVLIAFSFLVLLSVYLVNERITKVGQS